jgi:elongator complex protein 2
MSLLKLFGFIDLIWKELGSWEPDVTVGGHFGEVVDMQWEPGGCFLFSVSTDQTTRIHAPWVRGDGQEVSGLISNV